MNPSFGALVRLFPDRDRRRLIWGIALPIMGGMMSQNVLNLVDIAMVGRVGDAALAATGSVSQAPSPKAFRAGSRSTEARGKRTKSRR